MSTKEFEFMYKGKVIKVTEDHPGAVISVDGREFGCHHHHNEAGLAMWMCDEAYFAAADLTTMGRHFADYQYLYDRPGRVLVDEEGQVVGAGSPGKHHGDAEGGAGDHSNQKKGKGE